MSCNKNVTICLFLNIFLSVSIVLINKLCYVKSKIPNITLSFFHFVVTFIGLKICEKFNVFQAKRLLITDVLPLAFCFCGFVVFTNLSLGFNTVGTFQVLKTLTMPSIMIIQTLMYHRSFSWRIKFSLIPISAGVVINSMYDIKFNIIGTVFALVGVTITSFYQVLVGEKQKELQVNSMQLLYYQIPVSAFILLFCFPIFEPPWAEGGLLYRQWEVLDLILVLLSGFVAFLVNVNIYWIIGNTSAVTYNVVGQLKFCFTIVGGYLLFMDPIMLFQGAGILTTVFGVSLYAYFKIQDQRIQTELPYSIQK